MDLERARGVPREETKAATHREEPMLMQMLLCFRRKCKKQSRRLVKIKNSTSERRAE